MVPKVSLIFAALAIVALLAPTAAAQEQTRVADTTLNLSVNPFLSVGNTLARDVQTFGYIEYEFCHGTGGFNPQDATFEVTLTLEGAPPWLTVTMASEATQSFKPPVGPTINQEEDCPSDTKGRWELVAKASKTAPYGEKATMTALVEVAEQGTSHTYKVPEGGQRELSIEMDSDPGDDITTQLENATNNPGGNTGSTGGNSGNTEPEESPSIPVMAVLIGVVLLVAAVRRR